MDRRLKIAIIGTRGVPARYGGFETCVDEVSTRLAAKGHDVTVYCRRSNYRYTESSHRGVKLVVLPTVRVKSLDTISHSGLSVLHLMFTRWDVVHVYGLGNAVYLTVLKILRLGTAISVDGLEWNRKKWGWFARLWFRFSESVAKRFADSIIADSRVIEDYYRQRHGVSAEFIPYGAYVDTATSGDDFTGEGFDAGDYVLFVGRLCPEKGVHYLIEAFGKVRTDRKLVIVGDDPYNREYVESLKSTEDPRVVFLGYVYGERYEKLCRNASVYVQPSELEGTSPALLAAMGFGCCVLVNGIDENVETIGDAGIAYRKNDVSDMAAKLQYLIDNPGVVEEYRNRAVERIRTAYNWDVIAGDLENLYLRMSGKEKLFRNTMSAGREHHRKTKAGRSG